VWLSDKGTVLKFSAFIFWTALVAYAQQAPANTPRRGGNPLAGKPEAIVAGEKHFGSFCAPCHGKGGKGAEAPSLHRSRVVLLSPPARLFDVIRKGIPGTEMPPFAGDDQKIWQMVSYVHSITRPGEGPPVPGDATAGHAVFLKTGCDRCHSVGGVGGALGPDLSSIAVQSSSETIRESILEPNAKIAEGFHTVRLSTRAGKQVTGVLKNQDNFSIQIIATEGKPAAFLMKELASLEIDRKRSLMPSGYGKSLSPEDLQNLLAFLDRQRKPFIRSQVSFQTY
jgi:putative heme-binding domain-containing protein